MKARHDPEWLSAEAAFDSVLSVVVMANVCDVSAAIAYIHPSPQPPNCQSTSYTDDTAMNAHAISEAQRRL